MKRVVPCCWLSCWRAAVSWRIDLDRYAGAVEGLLGWMRPIGGQLEKSRGPGEGVSPVLALGLQTFVAVNHWRCQAA